MWHGHSRGNGQSCMDAAWPGGTSGPTHGNPSLSLLFSPFLLLSLSPALLPPSAPRNIPGTNPGVTILQPFHPIPCQDHPRVHFQQYLREHPRDHYGMFTHRDLPWASPQEYHGEHPRIHLQEHPMDHPMDHSKNHPRSTTRTIPRAPQESPQGPPHGSTHRNIPGTTPETIPWTIPRAPQQLPHGPLYRPSQGRNHPRSTPRTIPRAPQEPPRASPHGPPHAAPKHLPDRGMVEVWLVVASQPVVDHLQVLSVGRPQVQAGDGPDALLQCPHHRVGRVLQPGTAGAPNPPVAGVTLAVGWGGVSPGWLRCHLGGGNGATMVPLAIGQGTWWLLPLAYPVLSFLLLLPRGDHGPLQLGTCGGGDGAAGGDPTTKQGPRLGSHWWVYTSTSPPQCVPPG